MHGESQVTGWMWAVHVTSTVNSAIGAAEVVHPVEAVFSCERLACEEADQRSREPGVVAASVTRFAVDRIGARSRVAVFVDGVRQRRPHVTDRPRRYVAG